VAITTTATSGAVNCSSEYQSALDPADEPGSGGVAHRTPVDLLTGGLRAAPVVVGALAAALIAAWLIVEPRTPDLAGQVYRVGIFRDLGFAIWDEHWYAGHHLPGYSLLFPPLGAVLGVRALGALAALASALLFERVLAPVYGGAARWGALWFAVAAVGDIWIGRVAFAVGVPFALAAVLTLMRGRPRVAAACAAACAAASPVAGLLLGLAGLTAAIECRSARALLVLGVPAAAVVIPLAVLFPEGGWEPFPIRSFAAAAVVALAFLWALPPGQRLLRTGGAVYLLGCVACVLVHSPVGSNIERYAVLLAGPLLLCALLTASPGQSRGRAGRVGPVGLAALSVIALWVGWGPVRETLAVAGSEATSASYYAPVEQFLAAVAGGPVRVEVPLTRSHWEAALLAPNVSLARGWEKQLETRYDRVLLVPGLTARSYRDWLEAQAVAYVALPDAALDPSSEQEGRLIRGGLPYLQPVFESAHWRIYRVLGAPALAVGPGRLRSLGHDSFTLSARAAGSFLVRVRYTRYWALSGVPGCVGAAPGGWTEVVVRAAGSATVAARFSLARALSAGTSCRAPAQ